MIDKILKIQGGIIQETLNIDYDNGFIRFKNRDPQITVLFDKPIKGIKINFKLNSIN